MMTKTKCRNLCWAVLTLTSILFTGGLSWAAPGTVLWTQQWGQSGLDEDIPSLATSSNGIFVAGYSTDATNPNDWVVRRHNLKTGNLLWCDVSAVGQSYSPRNSSTSLAVSGNRVFVAGARSDSGPYFNWVVRAYAAKTGNLLWNEKWSLAGTYNLPASLAVSGNRVFVAGRCLNAVENDAWVARAYAAKTGNLLWSQEWSIAGSNNRPTCLAVSGNQLFVAGSGTTSSGKNDGVVQAYNLKTGQPLWGLGWDLTGTWAWSTPNSIQVSGNRVIVAGNYTDDLTGCAWVVKAYTKTGDPLWTCKWDMPSAGLKAMVVSGNRVFVAGIASGANPANQNWMVRACDTKTGGILWTQQWDLATAANSPTTLVVSGNRVFAAGYCYNPDGNYDWAVQAYNAKTGEPLWTDQWSLAGGDNYPSSVVVSGNRLIVGGYCQNAAGNYDSVIRAYAIK
jgi:hypothetical protein